MGPDAPRPASTVPAVEQHDASGASIATPTALTSPSTFEDKHDGRERPERRLPIGAEVLPGAGVHFRFWAPKCEHLDVVFVGENEALEPLELTPEGNGYFSGTALCAADGVLYRYRTGSGDCYPDPASRFQPQGPHGPSQVVDPSRVAWHDHDWKGLSLKGQVFYELHPSEHILAQISRHARAAGGERSILLVAENEAQSYLFQEQFCKWQQKLRGTCTFGIPAPRFVTYLENHDQVANSARGLRLKDLTSPARYRAMAALWLLAPQTPLFFQGQEVGGSRPFPYSEMNVLCQGVSGGRSSPQVNAVSTTAARRANRALSRSSSVKSASG